jgi:ABC-type enterobactin transport system permease subunit
MPFNLSVRRTLTILGALALAAGAVASTGPVALASTATPGAATALCKTDGARVEGPADGVSLWYSATCRTAWAVATDSPEGLYFWVYNIDTGAQETATVAVNEQRTVTAAVDDAGTQSEACYLAITGTGHVLGEPCTDAY